VISADYSRSQLRISPTSQARGAAEGYAQGDDVHAPHRRLLSRTKPR